MKIMSNSSLPTSSIKPTVANRTSARTTSAVMTTIVSGDASFRSSRYDMIQIAELTASLQKPHRFHRRQDSIKQNFWIKAHRDCREHEKASPPFLCGCDLLLFI